MTLHSSSAGLAPRQGRRFARARGSVLAVVMLIGTMAYVLRDNFGTRTAASEQPGSKVQALVEQSRAFLDGGDLTDALETARRAVQLDPESQPAQLSLVYARIGTGDLMGAREAMAVAETLDPDDPSLESARLVLESVSGLAD